MKWCITVGRLFGINVFIHFTLLPLLGLLAFSYWRNTQRIEAAIVGVGFFSALFGCAVLHELGYALMARRFGIRTRHIALLPIGGVACLGKMPEERESTSKWTRSCLRLTRRPTRSPPGKMWM